MNRPDEAARPDDRPFRHPVFRRYVGIRLLARGASQIQAVAVGWQMYDLTHSAKILGFIGLAQFLPVLLFMLPAGHAADHHDRRRITGGCQCVSALALAVLSWISLRHEMTPLAIFGLVILTSSVRAFEDPPLRALLPTMIPPPLFPAAAAMVTTIAQIAIMAGPAMGGLLYGIDPAAPYAVSALCYLASITLIATLPPGAPPQNHSSGLEALFAGITFIRSRPVMLGAISLDLFAVLLGGATALLPIYARDILHTGSWGLGLLRAAPAAGSFLVSLGLAHRAMRRGLGMKMFTGIIMFGFATILFGLSTWLPLSILALVLLGAADVISIMVRQVLVLLQTPDEMRGRVGAVTSLFVGTSNQLGEFESGMTAWLFGTVPAVLIGGFGTIVIALLWMRLFPDLRRVDEAMIEGQSAPS